MDIKQVLSAPRSPWQKAYVERCIGSICRECLDLIIFGERSLGRSLASYVSYYNSWRTHLSLGEDAGNSEMTCTRKMHKEHPIGFCLPTGPAFQQR